ncbi:alpha-hydroxy-acid oxidizing protein, partial [Serratia sp. IR-2025]
PPPARPGGGPGGRGGGGGPPGGGGGRAFVSAGGGAGQAGVANLLDLIDKEMRVAMTLTGAKTIAEINAGSLVRNA